MKKIITLLLLVTLLIPFTVNAVGAYEELTLSVSSYSADETTDELPSNRSVKVDLLIGIEYPVSADYGYFYVEYDKDLFDFVSYSGFEGTAYDEALQRIYVEESYTSVVELQAGDVIGTITLQPKDLTTDTETTIEYYFQWESGKQALGEETLAIKFVDEEPIVDEEDEVKSLTIDSAIEWVKDNQLYVGVGAVVLVSAIVAVAYFVNKKSNN